MDIRKKLNAVQDDDSLRDEEHEIINQLMFLMFGRDDDELPKQFKIECNLDNEAVEEFLREKLKLDVKKVELLPITFFKGIISYEVFLN